MSRSLFQRKLEEKCGVVGVFTESNHASSYARHALSALQHRGQESAGISILHEKGRIKTIKKMGLVPHALTKDILKKLGKGKLAIAQNRYGTSGKNSLNNAQPIDIRSGKYRIAVGHNGNIPDLRSLKKALGEKKKTVSDTCLIASLIIKERARSTSWEEAISLALPQCQGAYCLVILTEDGSLFGARDPYGIRPLCLGRLPDGWILASESVGLDVVGAEFVRDIKPGEIIKIDSRGEINSSFFGPVRRPQICLFEYIYFARPDSFIDGKRVREGREESGRLLGKRLRKKGLKPELVIPTFDSGYPAAKGVAQILRLPIVDAITTSHYVGRTFIQPGQENRIAAVNGKHNIVPDEVVGKKVVVVDDSAVRLTTSTILVKGLREAGAKKIYMAFASPPVVKQCSLGIDMRSKKDLPASRFENSSIDVIENNIADHVKADAAVYLPIDETAKAMGGKKEDFYHNPFGGPHPIWDKQRPFKRSRRKLKDKPGICVFISGEGTNLQEIISRIEKKDIPAEITGVICNEPGAGGLNRAKKHGIKTYVIPRKELTKKEFDDRLISAVKETGASLIILAGWMPILSDLFVSEMQSLCIPILNLHPALLTKNEKETVATSRGRIPVIRGINSIEEALKLKLPLTGITIHQILPGRKFDVGPVVLKGEVRIKTDDTLETLTKRMHAMEYMLLPSAIKRTLHAMSQKIDVSKGDFPW